jgi:hypothetical protein
MKLAKWLIRIGCALLLASAVIHLYGYTFTDSLFAGSNTQPQAIAAYRTLFLALAVPLVCLVPMFLWAMRMRGGKKILVAGVLIPLLDIALMFHFLGIFIGTLTMTVATAPLAIGIFLWKDGAAEN